MNEIDFFNKFEAPTKGIPGIAMNRPHVEVNGKAQIGLELELEGRRLRIPTGSLEGIVGSGDQTWLSVEDGSLRNGGREFVLSAPISLEDLPTMVGGLFKRFEELSCVIENSNRCSTHVHINMGGSKVNEVTSVMALWYLFETALIRSQGEERESNHFCLSLSQTKSTLLAWNEFLTSGRLPRADGLKYSALNILPLYRFGSIEFRCGKAADNPEDVIAWSLLLESLVRYAKDNFKNPETIASAVSETGPSSIFKEIVRQAGPLAQGYLSCINDDFDYDCMKNLRDTQPILLGHPWYQWMEEIDKEYVPNPFVTKKSTERLDGNPQAFRGLDVAGIPRRARAEREVNRWINVPREIVNPVDPWDDDAEDPVEEVMEDLVPPPVPRLKTLPASPARVERVTILLREVNLLWPNDHYNVRVNRAIDMELSEFNRRQFNQAVDNRGAIQ